MSLYKRAGSEVWWASVTINGERVRVSTEEYDSKAAQKFHDKLKAKRHDAPVLRGKRWSTAVLNWAEAEVRSDSDIQSLAKFAEHYPDRLLSSVTVESIDKALKKFVKTDGTYNRYRSRIAAVLNLANVSLKLVKKRNKDAKVRTWLTHPEWKKLYAELPPHLKASAAFALNTGLRQANVLGLTWARVDLDRRVAWIEGVDSKSGRAISVPLNEAAYYLLKTLVGKHPEYVFAYRGEPYKEIKTAFQAACVRAGVGRIDPKLGTYSGFTWHGLRHTWATWHAQNGTPVQRLMELGGWADLRMVMNYYHSTPGDTARFVENVKADCDRKL